ncbi:inositol monophosphatase family protein [Streptomyces lasalocidi]
MDVDLDRALSIATNLAAWASETIRRPRHGEDVREKAGPADIVTQTDETIETHVRAVLRAAFPTHGIEGEEYGADEPTTPTAPHWVVDPVDGTTNYAHGIGWCSFSLGLVSPDGTPLLALVADPWRRETFTAIRGRGAHLNGTPIHAAPHTTLTGHLFLTEWAAHSHWPGLDPLPDRPLPPPLHHQGDGLHGPLPLPGRRRPRHGSGHRRIPHGGRPAGVPDRDRGGRGGAPPIPRVRRAVAAGGAGGGGGVEGVVGGELQGRGVAEAVSDRR